MKSSIVIGIENIQKGERPYAQNRAVWILAHGRKSTAMIYREFGKLGYEVSLLGMGCMRLPRNGDGTVNREKSYEMIRYAVDHGVNYFDSAYGYHNQTSEEVLGEALEGGRRDGVKIATKQPFGVMRTKDAIRRNLEATLRKLRTDHLDLYLIHGINGGAWPDIKKQEVLREYEKFKEEGLIRGIAFSYHGRYEHFEDIMSSYEWDMCQVQHNFLDTEREVTTKGIELAGKIGCALVIMEPLRGGNLGSAIDSVKKIYDSHPIKLSPVEWAFKFVANYPQVSTILSGMSTLEQVKENIELFSKGDMAPGNLSQRDLSMLEDVKKTYESIEAIPCTVCEYCLPCPQGVSIPGVFQRYNTSVMFGNFEPSRRTYMFLSRAGSDASKCVECGVCEKKCPQGIDIIQKLKTSHEALKGWVEN
ncbi:MAG: aldo/keto reductase [Clostridiales bacterium]|jgi:predicted aldo/keto reductase-like oxidoreductase|nr:aldo/keto reductase [Clostridiales bacterium]